MPEARRDARGGGTYRTWHIAILWWVAAWQCGPRSVAATAPYGLEDVRVALHVSCDRASLRGRRGVGWVVVR